MKKKKYVLLGLLSLVLLGTAVIAGDIEMKINGATDAVTIDKSDGSEAMRITADGKVGVGTNAPTEKLSVSEGSVQVETVSTNTAFKYGAHKQVRDFRFEKTVTADMIQPLAQFMNYEGDIILDIAVNSSTAGNSGTKTYLFQGGYGQLTTSWYKMVPLEIGRGHGQSTNGFDIYVKRGVNPYAYEFGIASNTVAKTLKTTLTERSIANDSRGVAYVDLSAEAEEVISSAGLVYSHRAMYVEGNVGIGTDAPTEKLEVVGNVGVNGRIGPKDASYNGAERGLYVWDIHDTNHVIYSTSQGNAAGKSPAGATPATPLINANHRMRFRTAKAQGFLFENHVEEALVDINGDNGDIETIGTVKADKFTVDCADRVKLSANSYAFDNGTVNDLGSILVANYNTDGQTVCDIGYHICNAQEVGILGIVFGCPTPGNSWIIGGFPNADVHHRSIWSGQDSTQCPVGRFPTWYSDFAGYKGRIHCQNGTVTLKAACCKKP